MKNCGLNYLALFDASPNPYLVLDRELYIVGANKAYPDSTKRALGHLVGRRAWDAFRLISKRVNSQSHHLNGLFRLSSPTLWRCFGLTYHSQRRKVEALKKVLEYYARFRF